MGKKTPTVWELQPHTGAKHLILRRYLEAWLPIMARYNGRIVFIDGFAGPGRYIGGEKGSPIIALEAVLNHPHFAGPARRSAVVFGFIESDPARKQVLDEEINALKKQHPFPKWMTCETEEGEFGKVMTELLDKLEKDGLQLAPTFVFIDPFGFSGAPMSLVARIMKNPRCECLINFMYEPVNRFLSHPSESIARNFDELFGTTEWRELLNLKDADERRENILELYRSQLHKAGGTYVRTFEMINEGNRTEYFLFFATKALIGLSKMKQAMWKADPVSGQVFSDRSDPSQMTLIAPSTEVGMLGPQLRKRFRGDGWIPIAAVERFVLESTPFSEYMHLKTKTMKPLEEKNEIEVKRPAGSKNRKGTYPEGTLIRFK